MGKQKINLRKIAEKLADQKGLKDELTYELVGRVRGTPRFKATNKRKQFIKKYIETREKFN